jgi:Family of unknown function (DUF5670)
MLLAIALILLVLWLLGFIVIPVGGSLIHVLLIIVILHFVRGRRSG